MRKISLYVCANLGRRSLLCHFKDLTQVHSMPAIPRCGVAGKGEACYPVEKSEELSPEPLAGVTERCN